VVGAEALEFLVLREVFCDAASYHAALEEVND
jgi:hypothetical protein